MLNILLALSLLGSAPAKSDTSTFTTRDYPRRFATGYIHNDAFIQAAPRISFISSNAKIPQQYSLEGKAGPVEDQGQCGSCWDFSLTSTLRGTKILNSKDPGRLSFNYLLNCDTNESGCDGGNFDAANSLLSPKGPPHYGTDGQYTEAQGQCVKKAAAATATKYFLLGKVTPAFKDIAYVISVLHRPVTIDVYADDNWQSYSSGVFNACQAVDDSATNHMVVIEGYDCEGACNFDRNGNLPNGQGTYLVRNSWGTVWGEKGYIRTKATDKQGKLCNSVAGEALYFDVK